MAKFKLQTVLDYRVRLEGLAQQEHSAALKKESELLLELTAKRQELAALHVEFEALQSKGILPQEFILYTKHIGHTVAAVAKLAKRCEAARQEVAARLQALCQASQDKKLLEKLKAKHLLDEQARQRQQEAAMLDEIAVQRFRG